MISKSYYLLLAVALLAPVANFAHGHGCGDSDGCNIALHGNDAAAAYDAIRDAEGSLEFVENKGQWDDHVRFHAEVPGGRLFLEDGGFTWHFTNAGDIAATLHDGSNQQGDVTPLMLGHVVRLKIMGGQIPTAIDKTGEKSYYHNYMQGADPTKWGSHAGLYEQVRFREVYPGVDMRIYSAGESMKYDFELEAGIDPAQIILNYQGADSIWLDQGNNLHIATTLNEMMEVAPYAYQNTDDGGKQTVACEFQIQEGQLRFYFPNGYDTSRALIIDPATLIFGSYSGSYADNWGYTATYDDDGNLYGGGISFAPGYPLTTGAYQTIFAGACDIAITKFSPDGSSLIYSTYIGGTANDLPHSMIVNESNELWLYGTTGSADFPITPGAYDNTFDGGTPVTVTNIINFPVGTDMFVSKLSAAGDALIGSTYLGGDANDGLNLASSTGYNYGDHARGEIIIDGGDNAYVASTTVSADFPVTSGSFQTSPTGNQDGIITKLNSSLTGLVWSSFIGGANEDAAYSMKIDGAGTLLVAGGTTSTDFPIVGAAFQATYQGGQADGWLARISNDGSSIINSTYAGTGGYDQIYFVEVDDDDDIYITGQTTGIWPTTAGVFSNPGSSQFLMKLEGALGSVEYSTVFGSGSSQVNIRPTAFLVDKCENVYISGWGGITNINYNSAVSNTFGMPLTSDATQSTTDGSDFYFIVFKRDALQLLYATYFGGSISREHVDGGTSRFDQNGVIYQAVCAGCVGGFDDFPTTPGAWSNTNNSSNCNLGVVKYEFDFDAIEAEATAYPDSGCVTLPVQFGNNSTNAVSYFWDFADGNTSTDEEPLHVYTDTGTYNVMMIAIDMDACIPMDTDYITIRVFNEVLPVYDSLTICEGDSSFLGGDWRTDPGVYVDSLISIHGCDSNIYTTLTILPDTSVLTSGAICLGDSFLFEGSYYYSTGTYTVTHVAANGCDSFMVLDLTVNNEIVIYDSLRYCAGDSALIDGNWVSTPGTYVDSSGVTGGCDTIRYTTITFQDYSVNTTMLVCDGDSVFLEGEWQDSPGLYVDSLTSSSGCDSTIFTALFILPIETYTITDYVCDGDSVLLGGSWQTDSGTYIDTFSNTFGCDSIIITELEVLPVYFSFDTLYLCEGDSVPLAGGPLGSLRNGSTARDGGVLYYDTLVSALGCDSIIAYEVVELPHSSGTDTLEICSGDSALLGGVWVGSPGTYSDTLVAANGCDSVVAVSLFLLPTYLETQTIDMCDGDSVFIDGAWQDTSGVFYDTLTASNGCDSVIALQLIDHPIHMINRYRNICVGDSFYFAGNWLTDPGVYYDSTTSVFGCDSLNRLVLDTVSIQNEYQIIEICSGDSIYLDGDWQQSAGIYIDTFVSSGGCDSVVHTMLNIAPVYTGGALAEICFGDSIYLGGAWQNGAGIYTDTLSTADGCDSVVTTVLTVLPSFSSWFYETICDGDSAYVGSNWESSAGLYYDTLTAANGCDSVLVYSLTVNPRYTVAVDAEICAGDSIYLGGAWQNSAGTYYDSLTASTGCDSVVQTSLQMLPTYNITTGASICEGDSIYLGGAWQNSGGTYYDYLLTAAGCDSFITTTLQVRPDTALILDFEICEGDSMFIAGEWRSTTGTWLENLTSATGCDSTVTTNLTVHPSYAITIDTSICVGESIFAAGATQFVPGTYVDYFSTTAGCDSTVTWNLTVNPTDLTAVDLEICAGDSVYIQGDWQTSPGSYFDTLTNAAGCDSLIAYALNTSPSYYSYTSIFLCAGDSALVFGNWETAPGFYYDSLSSALGCDSIEAVQVLGGSGVAGTENVVICTGEIWFAGGAYQTTSGTYYDTLSTSLGCDSIIETVLTVRTTDTVYLDATICDGDSVFIAGNWESLAGIYSDSLSNAGGCDSIVITTLVVTSPSVSVDYQQICPGDSMYLGGNWQSSAGIYADNFTNAAGCDSIVYTTLSVTPTIRDSVMLNICAGDSAFIQGSWHNTNGIFVDSLTASGGCDSLSYTVLNVLPPLTGSENLTLCSGDSIQIAGAWISTAGIYTASLTTTLGCDSIVSYTVNIDEGYTATDSIFICEGDSAWINGGWRHNSGTFFEFNTTSYGCDSTLITELLVGGAVTITQEMAICGEDSVYLGGAWQNESGTYVDTLYSSSGCDSIIYTTLDVNENYVETRVIELCTGDSIFVAGSYHTSAGEFFDVWTTQAGCDSVVVVEVVMLASELEENQMEICEGDSVFLAGEWRFTSGYFVDTLAGTGDCPSLRATDLLVNPRVNWVNAPDTAICQGESVVIQASGANNYSWWPPEGLSCIDCPDPLVNPQETTIYTLTSTDQCAEDVSAEILVEVKPLPEVNASEDRTIERGESVTLTGTGSGTGALFFYWENNIGDTVCTNCTEITVEPEYQTTYYLNLIDESGCRVQDPVSIYLEGIDDCTTGLMEVPNAFSPNEDGRNDRFIIEYTGPVHVNRVRIYNRWGELLHETEQPRVNWNGRFRGKPLNPGVYVYYIEGTCEDELDFVRVGNVTLLK